MLLFQLQRLSHKMPSNSSVKRKDTSPEANGNNPPRIDSPSLKELERRERETIVIWRKPITTLEYFVKELFIVLYTYGKK